MSVWTLRYQVAHWCRNQVRSGSGWNIADYAGLGPETAGTTQVKAGAGIFPAHRSDETLSFLLVKTLYVCPYWLGCYSRISIYTEYMDCFTVSFSSSPLTSHFPLIRLPVASLSSHLSTYLLTHLLNLRWHLQHTKRHVVFLFVKDYWRNLDHPFNDVNQEPTGLRGQKSQG